MNKIKLQQFRRYTGYRLAGLLIILLLVSWGGAVWLHRSHKEKYEQLLCASRTLAERYIRNDIDKIAVSYGGATRSSSTSVGYVEYTMMRVVLYHIPAESAVEVEKDLGKLQRHLCTQLKIRGHQPEIQLKWRKLKELECDGVMKNWYEVTLLYKGGDPW